MSDRFRKNHSVDGWPIEDTYTGLFFQSFNKDDLVVALNSYEDLAASQQERIEELEARLYTVTELLDPTTKALIQKEWLND